MSAAALKPVVAEYRQGAKPFNMGMVFPVSPQLRAEVLAGGRRPAPRFLCTPARRQLGPAPGGRAAVGDAAPDARHLEAGTIAGYSVGLNPGTSRRSPGHRVPVITDNEIWRNNPEKVFGVTGSGPSVTPNTHVRLVKALLRGRPGGWMQTTTATGARRRPSCWPNPSTWGRTSR